jgi:hypothetical protein
LSEVIADIESLSGGTLNKSRSECNLLRPSCNFLKLFTGKLNGAIFMFLLSSRLGFVFLLNDSVLLGLFLGANASKTGRRRFILSDGLFNVELVYVLD